MDLDEPLRAKALRLEKRTWCYVQPPSTYEVAPCKCGNFENQWSEFKGRVWCPKCEVDFIPEHNGIFDGPIGVGLCSILGISFDRFNLETQQFEPFALDPYPFEAEGQAERSEGGSPLTP